MTEQIEHVPARRPDMRIPPQTESEALELELKRVRLLHARLALEKEIQRRQQIAKAAQTAKTPAWATGATVAASGRGWTLRRVVVSAIGFLVVAGALFLIIAVVVSTVNPPARPQTSAQAVAPARPVQAQPLVQANRANTFEQRQG